MFQKSKINEPIDPRAGAKSPAAPTPAPSTGIRATDRTPAAERPAAPAQPSRPAKPAAPSMIAPDLKVIGNLVTDGDLQIEGLVEGDVEARTLVVGNDAHVKGEIRSTDVTVHGKVTGRIKGQRVRLASSARVDGDITHSSLAMEEGADFEGSIHRSDDVLGEAQAQAASGPRVMELNNPAGMEAEKAS